MWIPAFAGMTVKCSTIKLKHYIFIGCEWVYKNGKSSDFVFFYLYYLKKSNESVKWEKTINQNSNIA